MMTMPPRGAASGLYTKRSKNLKTEYESYAWLIDKKAGENRALKIPSVSNT